MLNLIRTDKPELASLESLNTALLEMQETMKDKVYDLSTPKGLKVATTDRSKLRKIRTSTENTRKELNRPYIDGKRLVDNIAKNITAVVSEIEGPLVEIIRADEERKAKIKAEKEEKERKRKADIQDVIHKIADAPSRMGGMDSTQLSVAFASMVDYEIDDSFMEFADQASAALAKATEEVSDLLAAAIKREEEDAARKAEDERLKKQKADLDRRQADIEAQEKPELQQLELESFVNECTTDGNYTEQTKSVVIDLKDAPMPDSMNEAVVESGGFVIPPPINEHAEALLIAASGKDACYTVKYILSVCYIQEMTAQECLDHVAEICRAYLNQGGGS